VDEATVHEVVAAGASRVVVVRAILDAADPSGAAARLRAWVVGAPGAEDPTPRGAGEVPHA
jgi:thiamine-phosphate pyrophosphorylase